MNTIALPIPLIARGIYNLLGFFFFWGGAGGVTHPNTLASFPLHAG